jgi:putative PIN family toxin of toxin-antitoxin system
MPQGSRFVFDANVIVSALLLPRSVPRQALDRALAEGRLLLSEPVIAELDDVLRRPGLERYIRERERMRFLVALVREADVVPVHVSVRASRDPKDDKYLELAVAGEATAIVSGDDDLLVLDPFRGVRIVTPRAFLQQGGL